MPITIACTGDNVVDCYVDHGVMFPGGNTLNVSVHARRSGAHSTYIGAIGRDTAGDSISDALLAEGVNTRRLRRLEGPTAHCIISHQDGDRVFVSSDPGVSVFDLDDTDLAVISGHDVAHIGQSSGLDASLRDVAARTRLSYDFSERRDPAHVGSIAPLCFLSTFSGGDLPEAEAQALAELGHAAGATWVLVTRGREGAILFGKSGTTASPRAETPALDTLGAGDTFIARTLVGLLRGEPASEILLEAARCAAQTCQSLGAFGHGSPISPDIIQPFSAPA